MTRPTRATTAGRVYLDLQAEARRAGRPTDELLVTYVLERFLFRVGASQHREQLVLKGGMLLAALDERRPTRDVDLLALATDNDVASITDLIRQVLTVESDDGVAFDMTALTTGVIREDDVYTGVRAAVPAHIHRARQPLRIDVNVGDPITPAPVEITYPAILGDAFTVVGYPIETVLAEKIVTMIDRGDTTTRERDFADVTLLIRRHPIDASTLAAAIHATATFRNVELRPLREMLGYLGEDRANDWTRFTVRSGLQHRVPMTYAEAITVVAAFADPILNGAVRAGRWDTTTADWRAT